MYKWYQEASVCYVYLPDIPTAGAAGSLIREGSMFSRDKKWRWVPSKKFRRSRWFTRGWTLQELIAPHVVEFYAADWTEIGTRTSIKGALSEITGIDLQVLSGAPLSSCNAAQIMSWAAMRKTTKIEDAAYSLLGLFGVNMPLIYGEGRLAFVRLQEEILRTTGDLSLLLWGPHKEVFRPDKLASRKSSTIVGPLALDPEAFKVDPSFAFQFSDIQSINLDTHPSKTLLATNADFRFNVPGMTSRGLRLPARILETASGHTLACLDWKTTGNLIVCLEVQANREDIGLYNRKMGANGSVCLATIQELAQAVPQTIYIQNTGSAAHPSVHSSKSFAPTLDISELRCKRLGATTHAPWNMNSQAYSAASATSGTAAGFLISARGGSGVKPQKFALLVNDEQRWVFLGSAKHTQDLKIRTPVTECGPNLVTEKNLDRLYVLFMGHSLTISLRRHGGHHGARVVKITSQCPGGQC